MRPTIRWIAALALPFMLLTSSLVDAQKKPEKEKEKDLDKNTTKTVKAGSVTGKVVTVYEAKKMVRIQITFTTQTIDPGQVVALNRAKYDLANARDRQGAINAQNAIYQAQMNLYKFENKTQEMEINTTDEVVVRMLRPREAFDAKGKAKRLTKKELDELKGPDKKLPGYTAEFSDIAAGQFIQVTLVRKKGAVAPKPVKKGKGKDDIPDNDLLGDFTPKASLIVIVREPLPSK